MAERLKVNQPNNRVELEPKIGELVLGGELDDRLADLYQQISPSVVNIQVRQQVASGVQQLPEFPFGLPFRFPNAPPEGVRIGQGSGWRKRSPAMTSIAP